MCNRFAVCGKKHLPRWRTSKKLRNSRGRFDKDRRIYKYFIISFMIYAVSMIGVNTIWSWAKSLEKTLLVENSYAVETITVTLEDKIYAVAKEFGISGYQMYRTAVCESNIRNIQSEVKDPNGPNGREDSWGYWQINLPSWPKVSRWEALDEDFAIRWVAEHWYKATWYAYNRKTDKCI